MDGKVENGIEHLFRLGSPDFYLNLIMNRLPSDEGGPGSALRTHRLFHPLRACRVWNWCTGQSIPGFTDKKPVWGDPRGIDWHAPLAATGGARVFNIQPDRCPTLVAVHHDPSLTAPNLAASAQLRLCEGTISTKDNNTTKNQEPDVFKSLLL